MEALRLADDVQLQAKLAIVLPSLQDLHLLASLLDPAENVVAVLRLYSASQDDPLQDVPPVLNDARPVGVA